MSESPIVTAAMNKANGTTSWPRGRCDEFCAEMYGKAASGYNSAVAHWAAIPATHKHPGDLEAPRGALVMFGGGSEGFGHSTLSEGAGAGRGRQIRTIDMLDGRYAPGHVSTATIQDVLDWGTLRYLGWADPFFGGRLLVTLSVPSAPPAGFPTRVDQARRHLDSADALLTAAVQAGRTGEVLAARDAIRAALAAHPLPPH